MAPPFGWSRFLDGLLPGRATHRAVMADLAAARDNYAEVNRQLALLECGFAHPGQWVGSTKTDQTPRVYESRAAMDAALAQDATPAPLAAPSGEQDDR